MKPPQSSAEQPLPKSRQGTSLSQQICARGVRCVSASLNPKSGSYHPQRYPPVVGILFARAVATRFAEPSPGHTLCVECLTHAENNPCYVRCGQIVLAEEARPLRMRYIDCGDGNWCVASAIDRVLYLTGVIQEKYPIL